MTLDVLQYVLGVMVFERHSSRGAEQHALLIKRKNEPSKGLLNGISGKIMGDENPRLAMIREFREETMILTRADHWQYFGTLYGLPSAPRLHHDKPFRLNIFAGTMLHEEIAPSVLNKYPLPDVEGMVDFYKIGMGDVSLLGDLWDVTDRLTFTVLSLLTGSQFTDCRLETTDMKGMFYGT